LSKEVADTLLDCGMQDIGAITIDEKGIIAASLKLKKWGLFQ
jgi:hypothetical protein